MKKLLLFLFLFFALTSETIKEFSANDGLSEVYMADYFHQQLIRNYPLPKLESVILRFENQTHNVLFSSDYYFDATNGLDANNGLSEGAPKKTISALQGITLVAGDRVHFKRNAVWHEQYTLQQSGSAGNPIVYSDYGTGALPIIDASDTIKTGWNSYATNVYNVSRSTQPFVVYINDHLGHQKTSIGAITQEYDWYWASNLLYLYSPNGINPSITYTAPGIEAGTRQRCVVGNSKSYLTFINIEFRDANYRGQNTGAVKMGPTTAIDWSFFGCLFKRSRISGLTNEAATCSGLLVRGCFFLDNGDWGFMSASGEFTTGEIVSTVYARNGWAADLEASQRGNIQGALGNLEIDSCDISYAGYNTTTTVDQTHGIYANASANPFFLHSNHIYSNLQGAGLKTRGSCWVYDNDMGGDRDEGVNSGGNGATNIIMKFFKNRFTSSTAGFAGIDELAKGAGKISIHAWNNTFYKCGNGNLSIADAIDTADIQNNIFWASDGKWCLELSSTIVSKIVDYNLYWRGDGVFKAYYGGVAKNTFADWKTATSGEANGLNVAPNLISPPTNFSPAVGSPVIDVGNDVGLPYNGIHPDMGAVETGSILPKPAIPEFNVRSNRIRYPTLVGTLDGSLSHDDDGTITAYQWKYVSGPYRPTFTDSTAAITNITWPASAGITIFGTHIFQLKVTDNDNLSDSIQVKFFVAGGTAGGRN